MRIPSLLVAFVLAGSAVGAPAMASPEKAPNTVSEISDGLARALSAELTNNAVRNALTKLAPVTPVDAAALDVRSRLGATITKANADLLAVKGLPAGSARLAQIRLGDESMVAPLRAGAAPLVAATPNDDNATEFTAYNPGGKAETVPTASIPKRPVLFVDVDVKTATRLGMAVIDQATGNKSAPVARAANGYWATQIKSIRFNDVEEPWFKGDAEIFAVTGGFDLNGDVRADTVDMPYLDDENHTYYPDQLILHWNRYKYSAADIVFMEDDGDTNYLALAKAIIAALAYITDTGAYVPLANAILDAMPSSWWTDDPDYVDSCYAVTVDANWTRTCARGNGTLSVAPFWVAGI